MIQSRFTPEMARRYWGRDLDVAILAACSVLDINNYNGNDGISAGSTRLGRAWGQTGPGVLLGYNSIAPGDRGARRRGSSTSGAPTARRSATWTPR